jgi:hypothetical protein
MLQKKMERAMGVEPTTACLEGRDSSHWATPAYWLKAWALYKNSLPCQTFFEISVPKNQGYDRQEEKMK